MSTAVFADVTSANVVGYNTLNKGSGVKYSIIGNSFKDVAGGTGIKFSDLKGDFVENDEIQVVYMTGVGIKFDFNVYQYIDSMAFIYGQDKPFWLNTRTGEPVTDADQIDLAKAVYLITDSGDAEDVTTAGEVKNVAHTHTFEQMYNMMAPASPVAFNPSDNRFDWSVPENTELQTVYMTGVGIKIDFHVYQWIDTMAFIYGEDNPFWLDTTQGCKVEAPITDAGEGCYLIFPAGEDPTEYGCVEAAVVAK